MDERTLSRIKSADTTPTRGRSGEEEVAWQAQLRD